MQDSRCWLVATLLAGLYTVGLAQAQSIPGAAPNLRYAVPAAISPQAAAILRPALERQAATAAERRKVLLDLTARRAVAVKDVDARLAATVERTGVRIDAVRLGGVDTLRVTPPNPDTDGRILIYVHGGAFVTNSAKSSISGAATMAIATSLPVVSVDYDLAPEHDFMAITGQVISVYRALLAGGSKPGAIGMFGDSAGGSIVAGSTLRLRDEGLEMPGGLVLLSPCTDLGWDGDTRTTLAGFDPVLDHLDLLPIDLEGYAGGKEYLRHPYASPVYGDYDRGFPPTLIQGGTREFLVSDFVREYQAIRAGGGDAILDLYEGMPHVFMMYLSATPEGKMAIKTARDFFIAHLKSDRLAQ